MGGRRKKLTPKKKIGARKKGVSPQKVVNEGNEGTMGQNVEADNNMQGQSNLQATEGEAVVPETGNRENLLYWGTLPSNYVSRCVF